MNESTSEAFFDAIYRRDPDPWAFTTSAYERERYERTLGLLGDTTYTEAFEPGCSIGVLTALVAPRCRHLLAIDISPTAVGIARRRCASFPNVEVRHGRLPDDVPKGPLDLVVFSEIGYYLTSSTLDELLETLAFRLAPRGLFVAAHWTGESGDHVLSGRAVHAALDRCAVLQPVSAETRPGYLLGSYTSRVRRRYAEDPTG